MAKKSTQQPVVHLVTGDVLDQRGEMLVIPTSGRGPVGDPWATYLGSIRAVPPTGVLRVGQVVHQEAPTGSTFRHLVYAVIIESPSGSADAAVIEGIAGSIGKLAGGVGVRSVVSPLLGTAVGGPTDDIALSAMRAGFRRTASPDAELIVAVHDPERSDALLAVPGTGEGDGPGVGRDDPAGADDAAETGVGAGSGSISIVRPGHGTAPVAGEPAASGTDGSAANPPDEDGASGAPRELPTDASPAQPVPPAPHAPPGPHAPPSQPAPPVSAAGRTRLVHDQPAGDDELGRMSLAVEVASLVREMGRSHDRPEAFAIHLDAPWGAGKSTLVGFIGRALAEEGPDGDPAWTVVSLDAWRESQLSPAWWAILGHLRRGVAESLDGRARVGFALRRTWRSVRRLWRIWVPPALVLVVLAVLARYTDVAGLVPVVTALVAVVVAVGGLGSRFLSLGSLQGARVHQLLNDNPMEEVVDQIWAIRRASPRPVLLVLDDLDRCNERFTVELLDAVQTLLRSGPEGGDGRPDRSRPPALIVLAVGDGRWLRAAYENAYAVFSDSVSEPGRPLGHLFLDKLFQLRVELPRLDRSQVSRYLSHLLDVPQATGPVDAGALEERIRAAPSDTAGAHSLDERMSTLLSEAQGLGDAERQRLAAVALEARRTDPAREARQRHLLEEYADLLEPNPRATKRFLMAYNVGFAARLTELEPLDPRTLALWTVVATRWPALAEWVRDELPHGDLRPVDVPGHPSLLLREPQVQDVVTSALGGPLDRDAVLRCCGHLVLRETDPSSSHVDGARR
ncbi:hypothetical protein Cch01nite_17830 [Cellulomonas chitinilytica]|uniref:KAP NTPase domain-containing protein n=1 Tax=Cellulomonas chitinilytica TaxID=398759 RepID=A0A919P4V7_9CELL|nr:P-loop NTPase fold protein [Cellulomonas chitinilytica]GIG21059.1 hypothetical protein Cch01nite_17830 [Cellulomonas chitinilytica]